MSYALKISDSLIKTQLFKRKCYRS